MTHHSIAIKAAYPGTCTDCGTTIKPGQLIQSSFAGRGWEHVVCPDPLPGVTVGQCPSNCTRRVDITGRDARQGDTRLRCTSCGQVYLNGCPQFAREER